MPITYKDIAHRLQPPLDCAKEGDLRGREFHNRLIVKYEGVDVSGCVFYHCFPSGLEGATDVDPAKSEKDVTLEGADLRGADFEYSRLVGANLQGADLRGANFQNADLQYASFKEADLQYANLKYVALDSANLQRTKLQDVDLADASLEYANLQGANLQDAYLEAVNLYGTNLKDANLQDANLRDANLGLADLDGAKYNERTDFEGSNITREQLDTMVYVEDEDGESQD